MGYEFHDLANVFPLIEGPDFDKLVADIRDNGQNDAITYYEGKILDGRNRYRACIEAGVAPFGGDFTGDFDGARKFVISSNIRRRHLDPSQAAMATAKLETLKQGRPGKDANLHVSTRAELAEQMGVSSRSVASARAVLDSGVPELIQAVEKREIAVSTAAEIAKLPQDEQRERVAQPGGYGSLTGNNEWYTPAEYIERARRVMGGFDLDPASNTIAQRRVQADNFFAKEDDGLVQEWHGRVWLNPPYSQPEIQQFIEKLVAEKDAGHMTEAILLVNNSTDTKWCQIALSAASAECWTTGRIRFVDPDGNQGGSPAMGQVFFYFGDRVDAFAHEFREIGKVRVPHGST